MATRNLILTAAAGQKLYAGCTAGNSPFAPYSPPPPPPPSDGSLPSYVPARGYFGNMGLNLFSDVNPCPANNCTWSGSSLAGPNSMFRVWCGGVSMPEWGTKGGFAIWGGGHASYDGNEVYVLDYATQLWSHKGTPSPYGDTAIQPNGEYPDGKPLPPHTYGHMAYLPPAWGGGTQGSMLQCGFGGAQVQQRVQRMDLATGVWSRFADSPGLTGFGNTYGSAVRDDLRQGFWIVPSVCNQIYFLSKTGVVTPQNAFTNLNSGSQSMACMVPDKGISGIIVNMDVGGDGLHKVKTLNLNSNETTPGQLSASWLPATMTGLPSNISFHDGFEYCQALNCIVNYKPGSNFINKLAIPADLINGIWAWTTETLIGTGGISPSVNSTDFNSHFRRFVWVPAINTFIWVAGESPVQAWRPLGV